MATASFDVKVGGDFACFTRPEFKVERVSYPIMTPSAARGIYEAIFWKPQIRWEIREIRILKPLRQMALLRNEVEDRQGRRPFFVEDRRQQRSSLLLRDVEYSIRAEMTLRPHAVDPLAKYADQFRRRLERGQCHHTPYLGTREFAAWFEHTDGNETPVTLDLITSQMLFDIVYREDTNRRELTFRRHGPEGGRVVRGYAEALFFPAEIQGGVLRISPQLYQRLYQMEGKRA